MPSALTADLTRSQPFKRCQVGLILDGDMTADDPYDPEALADLAELLDSRLQSVPAGLKITYRMLANILRDRGYRVAGQRLSEHANCSCICTGRNTDV